MKSEEERRNELNDFQKSILGYIRIEPDSWHRRDSYYLKELNRIHEARKNKKLVFSFNWAAGFSGLFWCWYRKMFVGSLIMAALSYLPYFYTEFALSSCNSDFYAVFFKIVSMLFVTLVSGTIGNYLYYYFIKNKLEKGVSAINNVFAVIVVPLLLVAICSVIAVAIIVNGDVAKCCHIGNTCNTSSYETNT